MTVEKIDIQQYKADVGIDDTTGIFDKDIATGKGCGGGSNCSACSGGNCGSGGPGGNCQGACSGCKNKED